MSAFAALALALSGCAFGGGSSMPPQGGFDVPRALTDVYASEIAGLKACKVGPVSNFFDLAIDPTFDSAHGTARIAITGTGMFNPHVWATIDLAASGPRMTHVRVFAERHDGLETLRRDAERWGNAAGGC